jgi:hypothetical protein
MPAASNSSKYIPDNSRVDIAAGIFGVLTPEKSNGFRFWVYEFEIASAQFSVDERL